MAQLSAPSSTQSAAAFVARWLRLQRPALVGAPWNTVIFTEAQGNRQTIFSERSSAKMTFLVRMRMNQKQNPYIENGEWIRSVKLLLGVGGKIGAAIFQSWPFWLTVIVWRLARNDSRHAITRDPASTCVNILSMCDYLRLKIPIHLRTSA